MEYVCNDIVKPLKVKKLRYIERVREMYDLAKCLPTPLMKGQSAMADNWSIRNEEFMTSDIQLAIKDGLPKPIRYELDDHLEE